MSCLSGQSEILTQQDLQVIQEKSALLSFPYDVGSIPTKIASSFSGHGQLQCRQLSSIAFYQVLI